MARKTWIGAACAAILALGVAACGSDNKSSSTSTAAGGSGASAKKNYKMTLIAGVKGDEFYITMNCGAQAKAKELGVTLDFQGPDKFDASLQTPIVNAVAAKKPDAVLVAPTDTKAMFAPIKQLSDAGTKIALVDTTLEQADFAVSQIASDNEGGGKAAADTSSCQPHALRRALIVAEPVHGVPTGGVGTGTPAQDTDPGIRPTIFA